MKRILWAITLPLALVMASPASAQNLVSLYDAAKNFDASSLSASAQYRATRFTADQAWGALLPNINFVANSAHTLTDYTPDTISMSQNVVPYQRWYGTHVGTFSAIQPLYRPGFYDSYLQSRSQLAQSVAQLVAAEQDLLLRLSQAYFDVLASQDSLASIRAQKTAITEQFASAKRNFEVGSATITDTQEAQARLDLIKAQEISLENDQRVKKLALDQVVGQSNTQPVALALSAAIESLTPQNLESWVNTSLEASPNIQIAQLALEIATLEVDRAKSAHLPTLDLAASMGGTRNVGGTSNSGTSSLSSHIQNKSIGVVLNVPLFAGFTITNRVRETAELMDKAHHDLDFAKRAAAQSTRAAYLNLLSGIGQVGALKAALNSSQLALESNLLGYRVGVRINIDVLNAQSQLYQTQRDLATAKYSVLMGQLKLKQANGTLEPKDVLQLNNMLTP